MVRPPCGTTPISIPITAVGDAGRVSTKGPRLARTFGARSKHQTHKRSRADGISFPARLLRARHVSVQSGPISIRICCLAAANCEAGLRRGGINEPARVRKGDLYPRALWQMRPRPEPDGKDARLQNARRARHSHWRPTRGAASLPGSREP